ncbi:hypothetical protein vseg_016118 [Gypsophila vaccaria]
MGDTEKENVEHRFNDHEEHDISDKETGETNLEEVFGRNDLSGYDICDKDVECQSIGDKDIIASDHELTTAVNKFEIEQYVRFKSMGGKISNQRRSITYEDAYWKRVQKVKRVDHFKKCLTIPGQKVMLV